MAARDFWIALFLAIVVASTISALLAQTALQAVASS